MPNNQFYNQNFSGGTKVVFPGHDGLPFRGSEIPDLRRGGKQPVERKYAKVKVLDLSKPDQLAEYQAICDLVAKGWSALSREEMEWVPEKQNWIVFIRYVEKFAEMEGELEQRAYYDSDKDRMAIKQ